MPRHACLRPHLAAIRQRWAGEKAVEQAVASVYTAFVLASEDGKGPPSRLSSAALKEAVEGFNANPEGAWWLELLFTIAKARSGSRQYQGVGREVIAATGAMTPGLVARLQHDIFALPEALAAYLHTGAEIVAFDLGEFGTTPVFQTMLTMAQPAMCTQSRELLEAAHNYLTYFSLENIPAGGGVALAAWLGNGQALAAALLRAVAVTAPVDTMHLVSDVMWALMHTTSLAVAPIQAALMDPSFPAHAVPAAHRAQFIRTIAAMQCCLEPPPEFTAAVLAFAKLCRLPWLRSP